MLAFRKESVISATKEAGPAAGANASRPVTIIAEGCETKNLRSLSDVLIEGTVTETLTVEGYLEVGEKGSVKGQITCQRGQIRGTVEGLLRVEGDLEIASTGKVSGEIEVGQHLVVQQGAVFNGTCKMEPLQPKTAIDSPQADLVYSEA